MAARTASRFLILKLSNAVAVSECFLTVFPSGEEELVRGKYRGTRRKRVCSQTASNGKQEARGLIEMEKPRRY